MPKAVTKMSFTEHQKKNAIYYAVNFILMDVDSTEQEDIDKSCERNTYEYIKDHCREPYNYDKLPCRDDVEFEEWTNIFLEILETMTFKNLIVRTEDKNFSVDINGETNTLDCDLFFRVNDTSGYEILHDDIVFDNGLGVNKDYLYVELEQDNSRNAAPAA